LEGDISALYVGSLATILTTITAYYPWFITHNILDQYFIIRNSTFGFLVRSSIIGFLSSAVSDFLSNSLRVIKIVKQSSGNILSYEAVIRKIYAESGLIGLFGRGLFTRILTNGKRSIEMCLFIYNCIYEYMRAYVCKYICIFTCMYV
jgi:hypothetical protein